MVRKLLIFTLSLLFPLFIMAQEVPQYTLSAYNPFSYNPAYSGLGQSLEANGTFRKQWVELAGSPMTQNLNIHMPIHYLSSGIGLKIENDLIGVLRNTKVALAYSYHMKIGDKLKISLGASGGIMQMALDGSKLLAPEGNYDENIIDHQDGLLPEMKVSGMTYDVDAGIYLKTSKLDFGISALHLTESKINYGVDNLTNFAFRRHFIGFAGYKINFNNSITLRPFLIIKTDLVESQLDFSTFIEYKEHFLLGIGYRGYNKTTQDATYFAGGMKLSKNWKILYSYDLSLSSLKQVNQGSHEIMLKYTLNKEIGKGRLPKIIYNPRLL